jgi:lipoprotein NlpI
MLPQSTSPIEEYHLKGIVKYFEGDFEGAIQMCNEVLQCNPKLPGAYYNRALARWKKGRESRSFTRF